MDEKEEPEMIKTVQDQGRSYQRNDGYDEGYETLTRSKEKKCRESLQCGASYSERKESLDIDSVDVSDDVKALVEGEDLSEEFQTKACYNL